MAEKEWTDRTDRAPVLIARCDGEARYKFVNRPYASRFGLQPQEVVGKPIREVLGENAYAAIEPHVNAALAGERVEFEIDIYYDGLGKQTVRVAYDPEFDAEGRVVGFIAAIVNIAESRRAREVQRESEERLRTLSDNLPRGAVYQGVVSRDGRRKITYISAGVEGLLGVTPAEALADANAVYGLIHEADRDRLAVAEEAALRNLSPFDCEFRSYTRSGALIWVHARSAPRLLSDGETVWDGIVIDATGRKGNEALLESQNHVLEQMVQGAPLSEVLESLCQTVQDQAGERLIATILLLDEDGVLLRPAAGRRAPAGWTRAIDPLRVGPCAGSCGTAAYRKERVIVADIACDPLWADFRDLALSYSLRACWSTPIASSHGKVVGTFAVYYDVPRQPEPSDLRLVDLVARTAGVAVERRRAEEALRTSRERLDLVVNSVDMGLWYCDLPFNKLIWNAKVKEHFGLPIDYDVTINDFYERLHPDDRERTRQAIERSIRDHAGYDVEYRTVGLDGSERWVRAIGRAFDGPTGQPVSFDGVTVDVTQRVRQEQALKEADRRKDEFIATLAHELRNPLAPIRNAVQLLRLKAPTDPTMRAANEIMDRQVNQMVRLVDDLLEVSRITQGKLQLRREQVELTAVLRNAVETARPLIDAAGHELTIAWPAQPILLDADPVRLAQVVANLLNNAAKYTDRGGRIGVTAERRDGEVVVSVRDTGIGVAAEHLPRLFEMFSQVAPALERSQGGLGIGLSLVKGLVEMHGGAVEARSEGLGRGSEFIVRLPAPVVRPDFKAVADNGAKPASTPIRRILVVDDNRDAADSLGLLLRIMGHETEAAYDGLAALAAAEQFRPEVMLLDIGLPGLNGYELARRTREQAWGRGVMLAALTGWGQEDDKRRAVEAGFDCHMTKPVDLAALQTLLAALPEPPDKTNPSPTG